MGGFGMGELIVILLIVVLLFGAAKLPQLGAGMGKAIKSFKDAVKDEEPPAKPDAPKPPDDARS
jgi:sec-independent protein translocase protein TatA